MTRAVRIGLLAIALALATSQPALAHDCSSPQDCEQTAGYNAVIALAGGALALASGLFGNAIAGGSGGETAGQPGGEAEPPLRRRGCCLGWFSALLAVPTAFALVALRLAGLFGG